MRLVLNIPRMPARRLWEDQMLIEALVSGTPTHFVASSRGQAKRTYLAAQALINGRDPKAHSG